MPKKSNEPTTNFPVTEIIAPDASEYALSLDQEQFFQTFPNDGSYDAKDMLEYYKQVRAYLLKQRKNDYKGLKIRYTSPSGYSGRLYGRVDGVCLQRIHRALRHFLCQNIYFDYDIQNCHPVLFYNLCKEEGLTTEFQEKYIENRELFLDRINRDDTARPYDKVRMIQLLNMDVADIPKNSHKDLVGLVSEWSAAKLAIYEKAKDKDFGVRPENSKNTENPISSFNTIVLQCRENILVQHAIGKCNVKCVSVPMFDGFMCPKRLSLDKLNSEDQPVTWVLKAMQSAVIIPEDFKPDIPDEIESDQMAAEVILKIYPHIKLCQKNLYIFNFNDGMWHENDETLFRSILFKNSSMLEGAEGKNWGSSVSAGKNVYIAIKSCPGVSDDGWLKRVEDSGIGKLLYKDGIYNMGTKQFKKGYDPNIVFFSRIPFDFPERDEEKMREVYATFFHNPFTQSQIDNGVPRYFLQRLAKAIAGDYVKDFHLGLGLPNAGKSSIVTMMERAFEGYVSTFSGECFGSQGQKEEACLWRWALNDRYKRLLFSHEIKMTTILDGAALKRVSGGDALTGRGHGSNEVSFHHHFTNFFMANDLPEIANFDKATRNRGRCIAYKKSAVDKPENECTEYEFPMMDALDQHIRSVDWIAAFSHLLFDAYSSEATQVPSQVFEEFKEWTKGMSMEEAFEDDFIFGASYDDMVVYKDIQGWLKSKGIRTNPKKLKDFLLRNGCITASKNGCSAYRHLKRVVEEDT